MLNEDTNSGFHGLNNSGRSVAYKLCLALYIEQSVDCIEKQSTGLLGTDIVTLRPTERRVVSTSGPNSATVPENLVKCLITIPWWNPTTPFKEQGIRTRVLGR